MILLHPRQFSNPINCQTFLFDITIYQQFPYDNNIIGKPLWIIVFTEFNIRLLFTVLINFIFISKMSYR